MPRLAAYALVLALTPWLSFAAEQPADAVSRAREALDAIAAKEFAKVEAQFTEAMKAALPPGRLAGMWAKLVDQAGALKRCGTEPRVRDISDKRMVITPCEFERATIDVQFAFDSSGKMSGLVFRPATPIAPAGSCDTNF